MDIKPNKRYQACVKASEPTINAILKDIKEGSTHRYAAEANGITANTFCIWQQQGRCDLDHGNTETIHAKLVKGLAHIKQDEIKKCREMVRDSKLGHKGAQWTLEKVYWQDYGSSAAEMQLNERLTELENQLAQGGANHGETNDKSA